ncbi:MAG: hypothetical protein LUD82_02675 [Clostridiales bacterium]|nr:hypothetical protein [Clostridiales bacterium]
MFGKLCKLELRYMMRNFLPLWGVALALALVNGLLLPATDWEDSGLLPGLLLLVLVCVMIAMVVLCVVLIVQRFYHGLLKNEGYLMFTLPVKTGSLILSKGLAALVAMVGSALVGALAFLLLMGEVLLGSGITGVFYNLYLASGISAGAWAAILTSGFLYLLASVAFGIQTIYLAQAVGHMASSHRVGVSVLAYIGLSMVLSILGDLASSVLTAFIPDGFLVEATVEVETLAEAVIEVETLAEAVPLLTGGMLVEAALQIVGTVIFFLLTRYILDTRLNLE